MTDINTVRRLLAAAYVERGTLDVGTSVSPDPSGSSFFPSIHILSNTSSRFCSNISTSLVLKLTLNSSFRTSVALTLPIAPKMTVNGLYPGSFISVPLAVQKTAQLAELLCILHKSDIELEIAQHMLDRLLENECFWIQADCPYRKGDKRFEARFRHCTTDVQAYSDSMAMLGLLLQSGVIKRFALCIEQVDRIVESFIPRNKLFMWASISD